MGSKKKSKQDDFFGDDFEVTYLEEDYEAEYSSYKDDYEDTYEEEYEADYEDEYSNLDDDYDPDSEFYDEFDEYDDYPDNKSGRKDSYGRSRPQKKRRRRKAPNLMKPAQKTIQSGGKVVGKLLQMIARMATLVIIAAMIAVIGTRFWDTHSLYGNINTAVAERNYALAAYLGVGAVLVLFEIITFLWALTSEKVRDGRYRRRQDVGRGFTSFFLICAGSYMALKFSHLLPESTTVLAALKAALALYGSMNLTLLLLGIAGMISCIFRRFAYR